MLSEKVIKELISTPVFISNASKLAYVQHVSRQDASQELLLKLMFHRLNSWSNDDVTLAVQRDLPSLKWRIKYARKDIVRKEAKLNSQELEKASMVAHMEPQASNEAETLEALGRLRELFKNAHTRDWVESVLRVGQRETMVRFNQIPRQFNSKLVKVCKYARQHQHRQPKQSNNSHTKELKLLKEWDDLMDDPDTDDNSIQSFIDQHEEYINEVINSPQVAFQGRLIKDFAHAGKDKYVLVNLIAKRERELDRRTNHE
ncbi:hypothetical protein FAM8407_00529 [Lacticaseibacillus paracasei]|uniref:hypothetical protein n=1 Tax=Lacticaseibacillus paracasei TaxID=1597 RepID=UPI000F0B9033|nr:hypothetical protein [Lacticaseibacillus paracasei]RNE47518.1 hypothetical protein FAM8407_00529 [Lacticaseibacillus paracasei]